MEVTISNVGNNNFSITCSGDGGSKSASVTIEGYRNTSGVVVDGYITGSDVYIDKNENWIKDTNEDSVISDILGKFTLRYSNGSLISVGGSDLDSQVLLDDFLLTHKLTGHTEFKVITPITSVMYFMNTASNINSALGIDNSIDVLSFDPVANKGDGGINDYVYEKGNQLTIIAYAFQNLSNDLKTGTDKTQDYFKAIAEELEKEYNESNVRVDIESEAFISKVLENLILLKALEISDESKENTINAMSGLLPIIQVKTDDNITTSLIRFGLSTFQSDIKSIGNGTASQEVINNYTSNILSYIANDQSIEIDDITPDISAINDSASTNEDTSVDIDVLANDSYLPNSPISISIKDSSNGTTVITDKIVTYTPLKDFNGSDLFTYTITQAGKTSSANVEISINAMNDEPVINLASTIQVKENQKAVASNFISDVDTNDSLSLSISGTDADSFNLSTDNDLTFKTAPDFETKKSYSITLTLTDGTATVIKDITILILDIIGEIAPIFISLPTTIEVNENTLAVHQIKAFDEEGDNIIYLISGIDADEFNLSDYGLISFKSVKDFESNVKKRFDITITISDGTNSLSREVIVVINNLIENQLGESVLGNSKLE
tara:strand:- start:1942 stop:3771 length:1830 start_codon:yes stop_codon:yes gene_type:complete